MVALIEEMIMRADFLPPHMEGWRRYRIEYGFEDNSPEGHLYLPPNVDPDTVEDFLTMLMKEPEHVVN